MATNTMSPEDVLLTGMQPVTRAVDNFAQGKRHSLGNRSRTRTCRARCFDDFRAA